MAINSERERRAKSICFISHRAYGALTGGASGHPGGIERQVSLMARALAKQGFRTSVLTWDEGQPQDEVIDGVRVIKMCSSRDGLPGLRFISPRWTSLNRALARADADLYYHNGAEYVTGQIAMWCKKNKRKFVFSSASDPDCHPDLPEMRSLRERVLYRYGLRNSDHIIVQTEAQRKTLRAGFGLEAEKIPMPCPGPADSEYAAPHTEAHNRVVWVGRLTAVKRLDFLIEVAKLLPAVSFHVAGPVVEDDFENVGHLAEKASEVPNITLLGQVGRAEMPDLYSKSALLVCTSSHEGFPNVFLEAWSRGVPIVSTVDPDSLITERGLGLTGNSPQEIAHAIEKLLGDQDLWRRFSENSRKYYVANHMFAPVMERFARMFRSVLGEHQTPVYASRTTKGPLSVSVVIPTYDRAKLVERAIKSAIANILPGDEIIVIDDGSTDGSEEVIRGFGAPVRYVKGKHRGAGAARNLGIELAQNDLIAFLDSDDEWMPGKLNLQRALLEARPDILFCFSNFTVRTPRYERANYLSTWLHTARPWDQVLGPAIAYSTVAKLLEGASDFGVHFAKVYRNILEENFIFTSSLVVHRAPPSVLHFAEDLPTYEDWECFGRLARAGMGAYLDRDTCWNYGHAGPRLTDADEFTCATTRLRLVQRVWGSDAEFLSSHRKTYDAVVAALRVVRTHAFLEQGRSEDARMELQRISHAVPLSYRLSAALPSWALRLPAQLKAMSRRSVA